MAVREIKGAPSLERWFPTVASKRHCVWLDGKNGGPGAEWSVLAWDPVEVRNGPENNLLEWMDEFSSWRGSGDRNGVPFEGGLIGVFDYADKVEPYPPGKTLSLFGWLGLYEFALVENLGSGTVYAVSGSWLRDDEESLGKWIEGLTWPGAERPVSGAVRVGGIEADGSRGDYEAAVRSVKEWIAAGDIYQANLAQRFSCEVHEGNAPDLYGSLRKENPAPFSAYLDCGSKKILSTSPELFLSVDGGGTIRTRPIKGTRPRGADAADDQQAIESLRADPKELAELLMIVDMERNDLGRVCRPGSVGARRDFAVETFASVHHLVGDVSGMLREGVAWSDIFAATFPGGSITGAPKFRAMEIIRATERSRRKGFCGSIGYVTPGGGGMWSIAIRTIEWTADRIEFGVGSGIVWDSDPAAEYRETLHKALRLFVALGQPVDDEDLQP